MTTERRRVLHRAVEQAAGTAAEPTAPRVCGSPQDGGFLGAETIGPGA